MDRDLTGRVLGGRFELLRPLGEGGYGAVYVAKQLSMDRQVAIKVIHPRVAQTRDFVDRFEREARVASRLQHPNTVVYFDFGRDEDVHFLAMEFVKGRTLGSLISAEGSLSPVRAAHVARQICGALGEAHAYGMVHRDLKPANILLTHRGRDPDFVKVIDFGLAKIVQGDLSFTGQDLTSEGVLLGTPAYMAPEQIRGKDLDHRCDIYALGVIMFVMLTGKKPYEGDTPLGTAVMHLTEAIPLVRELNPAIPEEMQDLVFRCMAKDPDDRPRDVNAIADELDAFLAQYGMPVSGSVYSPPPGALTGSLPSPSGEWSDELVPPTATLDRTPSTGRQRPVGPTDLEQIGARHAARTLKYADESSSVDLPAKSATGPSRGLVFGVVALLFVAGGVALFMATREGAGQSPPTARATAGPPPAETVEAPAAVGSGQPDEVDAAAVQGLGATPATGFDDAVAQAQDRLAAGSEAARVALVVGAARSNVDALADAAGATADEAVEETPEPRRHRRHRREETEAVRSDDSQPVEEAPRVGMLRINAVPYGRVYCEGENLGRTPIVREVEVGTYDCRVVSPQGVVVSRRVDVVPGDGDTIVVRFDE